MMTPYKIQLLLGICATVFLASASSFSDVKRYESGLGREWEFVNSFKESPSRQTESQQIAQFFKENFSVANREGEWKEWKEVKDGSHHHHHYHYFHKGRRVEGIGLDLHYNLRGWVQYASSDLEKNINVDVESDSAEARLRVANKLSPKLFAQMKRAFKSWQWEPLLWKKDSGSQFLPVYEVQVIYDNPVHVKNLIVDQNTGEILVDYKKVRYSGDTSRVVTPVSVYKNSVNDGFISSSPSITTDSNSILSSSQLHVYREDGDKDHGYLLREITPDDYTLDHILNPQPLPVPSSPVTVKYDADPDHYNSSCSSTEVSNQTKCANQAFDGVNVFYHLTEYRSQIVKPNISATLPDPLTVIVNRSSEGFDNAKYNPEFCGSVPVPNSNPPEVTTIYGCLVFLPPTGSCSLSHGCSLPGCADNSVINNFAREAFVIAHEYQHYVTDKLSGLEYAPHSPKTVGDALHEGYSDYGAATYLTQALGVDTTLGLVSFPACSGARRDLKDLRVYQDIPENSDEHMAGLTWASSLWQLRQRLGASGASVVDSLMFKSMTFLGSNPGFVSSVESLVKADVELYGGAHIALIRQVLYTEAKFTGSETAPFKDPLTLEANVGFKGCGGVFNRFNEERSRVPAFTFLVWGILTILLGRFLSKRTST
jgi:hypothetical protein